MDKLGEVKQKSLGDSDTMYFTENNNTLYQGAKEVSCTAARVRYRSSPSPK